MQTLIHLQYLQLSNQSLFMSHDIHMGICNSNDNHPTLGGFAIASPIPALEPVTKGTLPFLLKFETTPKNIAHACSHVHMG